MANQPACIQPTTQPASQPAKKLLVNQTIISPYKKDRLIAKQHHGNQTIISPYKKDRLIAKQQGEAVSVSQGEGSWVRDTQPASR